MKYYPLIIVFISSLLSLASFSSEVVETPGKYSPNYSLSFKLTPENVRLNPGTEKKEVNYFARNQFEVYVEKSKFPIVFEGKNQFIVLRMPGNDDPQCKQIGEKIQNMITTQSGELTVDINLSPYGKKINDKPLTIQLLQPNIFFKLKNGTCPSGTETPQTGHLYSGLKWEAPIQQRRNISNQEVPGFEYSSATVKNVSDISKETEPFREFYKRKLKLEGWQEDLNLSADGPGSSEWGYKKGPDWIILSYLSESENKSDEAGFQCPCQVSFKVFTTLKP